MKKPRKQPVLCLFTLGSLLLATSFSHAQNLPNAADPARLNNDLRLKTGPVKAVSRSEAPSQAAARIPAGAEKIKFQLKAVTIDGASIYSDKELRDLYQAYTGQQVSLAQVLEIVDRIQHKYLDDGYTLTKVSLSSSDYKKGHVHITVIEGYVAEIDFRGPILAAPIIDDAVKKIKGMHPLNTKKLERIMLILNDLPGTSFSAILASTKTPSKHPGAIRLILDAKEKSRFSGFFGVNNYGSEFSGPWQMIGNAHVANVIAPYSDTSLTTNLALPLNELKYGALSYTMPVLGVSGTTLTAWASGAFTQPGDYLKDLDIRGKSYQASLQIAYPVIRQRDKSLSIQSSFDVKNSNTDIAASRLYDDRLRVVTAGVNYSFADSFYGLNGMQLTFAKGLDIFGARETGSVDLSRGAGHSDFRKFQATIGRRQALPANFELYGTLNSQYAFDPLLSVEEIGFGGSQFGRGYDPSEITGDNGLIGSIELRRNINISGGNVGLQPYLFYDMGKVWNIDPGAKDNISASSTGAGLRVETLSNWKTDINIAFPLTKDQANPPPYTSPDGPRALFSLTRSF